MNKFIAGSIVSIGLTAATVALSAQTVTPPGAGGQTMQHGERHHGKRAFSMPGERVEARLAYMKTALKITDAQQAQWNAFADVARGNLRLLLSGEKSSAGRPMPDGRQPGPGGWNRIHLLVDDIAAEVERLRAEGVTFRNDIVRGPGGAQIVLDDPSGNPIELFQPAGT